MWLTNLVNTKLSQTWDSNDTYEVRHKKKQDCARNSI